MTGPRLEFQDREMMEWFYALPDEERERTLANMRAEDEDLARLGYDTSGPHVFFSFEVQRIKKALDEIRGKR